MSGQHGSACSDCTVPSPFMGPLIVGKIFRTFPLTLHPRQKPLGMQNDIDTAAAHRHDVHEASTCMFPMKINFCMESMKGKS